MVKQALHCFTAVFGRFEDNDIGMFEEWEKEVEQALHLLTGGSMAAEWKYVVMQALHFSTEVSGRFGDDDVGVLEEWKQEVDQALHILTGGLDGDGVEESGQAGPPLLHSGLRQFRGR